VQELAGRRVEHEVAADLRACADDLAAVRQAIDLRRIADAGVDALVPRDGEVGDVVAESLSVNTDPKISKME